jgi:hypothetical protein
VHTLFLTCAVVGGVLVLAQLVMGAVGAEHHHVDDPSAGDGLQLLSVRALGAALAFFGVTALGISAQGVPWPLAAVAGLLVGTGVAVGVAFAMRAMLGLQRDASVRVEHAVGSHATVYIPIPAAREGTGKVLLTLGGRTVELPAVTPQETPLHTGAAVIVVEVHEHDVVEVVPVPSVDGVA